MKREYFVKNALEVGFTEEQADFMFRFLSNSGHNHPQYALDYEVEE